MEYRRLGKSGLTVPALSYGTATFGGTTEFFKSWGDTQDGRRIIDLCLEHGLNFFDTADVYSQGVSEEILGRAIGGKRSELLISTKATFPMGSGSNDFGSSRFHLLSACDASLLRLKTDYIDVYHMHGFDAVTPIDETLRALDDLISSGKVRYIACSNFSGWHLMKSLSISEKNSWAKYIAHQVYYSLVGRDYEFELMPLAIDQGIGAMVWSPLAGGALSGKISRSKKPASSSRAGQKPFPDYDENLLYNVVDVLEQIAAERSKTVSQVALNWVLSRPTISNIVVGARNEEQLKENLGAVGWHLTAIEIKRLDQASATKAPYPYWHQQSFPQLIPPIFPRAL